MRPSLAAYDYTLLAADSSGHAWNALQVMIESDDLRSPLSSLWALATLRASDPEVGSAACAEAFTAALATAATMEQTLDAKSLSLIIWSTGVLVAHVPMFLLAALLGDEFAGAGGLYLYGCNSGAMQDQLRHAQLIQTLDDVFCSHPWWWFCRVLGGADHCGDISDVQGRLRRMQRTHKHLGAVRDRLRCGRCKPHVPLLLPSLVKDLWRPGAGLCGRP